MLRYQLRRHRMCRYRLRRQRLMRCLRGRRLVVCHWRSMAELWEWTGTAVQIGIRVVIIHGGVRHVGNAIMRRWRRRWCGMLLRCEIGTDPANVISG